MRTGLLRIVLKMSPNPFCTLHNVFFRNHETNVILLVRVNGEPRLASYSDVLICPIGNETILSRYGNDIHSSAPGFNYEVEKASFIYDEL